MSIWFYYFFLPLNNVFWRVSISVNWVYIFIFNICFTFYNMPLIFPLFYYCLICFHCLFPRAFQLVSFSVLRLSSFKLLEEKGGAKKIHEIRIRLMHCGYQCLRLHRGQKIEHFEKKLNGSHILPDDTGKSSVGVASRGVEPTKRGLWTLQPRHRLHELGTWLPLGNPCPSTVT